ncbi:hypothetical protein [Sutterella sp.]|uniref:hypothetical protein n=1 Tax=Sutterella sp. TaxID=1981025 RepID=UPI0026DF4624|nr:hypothetical protein [Sutterella sp.]MDO5531543.1 hypothetical protein [Sutterella sp.]
MKSFRDYANLGPWPNKTLSLISIIRESNVHLAYLRAQNANEFRQLSSTARFDDIYFSTLMDDFHTSDRRFRAIINYRTEPKTMDECGIAGYRDALDLVQKEYKKLRLTPDNIRLIHDTLTSHTRRYQEAHPESRWKSGGDALAEDAEEEHLLPAEFEALRVSFLHEFEYGITEPLALIPRFLCDISQIEPFHENSLMMDRLIQHLLMLQSGFDFVRYVSIEKHCAQTARASFEELLQSENIDEILKDSMYFVEKRLSWFFNCAMNLKLRFTA